MAPIAKNYHFWAKNAYHDIVLHDSVLYCMELLCILWYCIVLHCIIWYCMVLHCWLRRVGCISQDTYLLYYVHHPSFSHDHHHHHCSKERTRGDAEVQKKILPQRPLGNLYGSSMNRMLRGFLGAAFKAFHGHSPKHV